MKSDCKYDLSIHEAKLNIHTAAIADLALTGVSLWSGIAKAKAELSILRGRFGSATGKCNRLCDDICIGSSSRQLDSGEQPVEGV